MAAGMGAFLQVYAFPPSHSFARSATSQVIQGDLSDANRSVLASEKMVPGAPESHGGSSVVPAIASQPTQIAPLSSPAPEPPRAEPSCMATIQWFARHLGLSRRALRAV